LATPSLASLIKQAIDSRLIDLHTAMPAKVERYYADRQLVDVQPQIKRELVSENGARVGESLPLITDVPVLFPRAGGYFISFPIQKGDFVQLLFNEHSLSKWHHEGKEGASDEAEMHGFQGAVAILGLYPNQHALKNISVKNLALGKSDGAQIHITPTEVLLGSKDATKEIALADKVLSELRNIASAFNAHVHPYPGTAPPLSQMSLPGSVASQKVKAL